MLHSPHVLFSIHINTVNVFYNIKQQKKKKVTVNVAKNTHLWFFLFTTTHRMLVWCYHTFIHAPSHDPHHTPLTQHKKHNKTMASLSTITPSSITSPTDGRWPPNLFQPLPNIHTHHLMHRQLQCHSCSHVRSRRPSRTHEFTSSTTPNLVEFILFLGMPSFFFWDSPQSIP
jgi:hypothetical protein